MAATDFLIGPVKIMRATAGTTLPVYTLPLAGAWPAGWVEYGVAKEAPVTMNYGYDTVYGMDQHSLAPVVASKRSEHFAVETVLSEFTLTNLSMAWSTPAISSTAPGSGTPGYEEVSVGDTPALTAYAWGFEGSTASGLPFRVFIFRGVAITGGKLEFGNSKYVGVALHIDALRDSLQSAGSRLFRIQRITAAALP